MLPTSEGELLLLHVVFQGDRHYCLLGLGRGFVLYEFVSLPLPTPAQDHLKAAIVHVVYLVQHWTGEKVPQLSQIGIIDSATAPNTTALAGEQRASEVYMGLY
jgi:hypothetical protein